MTQSITVLHVEGDAELAELVSLFLKREDPRFTVLGASDAAEGLEILEDNVIDCIVSDYDLPGQNGIEFLEAVRESHPQLPFILFTGKGSEEVASEAISANVTDYLQKAGPISQYTILANRITNAVDRHWSKRELAASEERLSLFFDQSPLGVIEWDEEFTVSRVNQRAQSILGYAEDELVGSSWERFVPAAERESITDAVVNGVLEDIGGYHRITENVRKDGERITCEWHNRVVYDDSGDVVAIFSQFHDITERSERETELELKTRAMDAAPVGIAISDPALDDNPLMYVNRGFEELTGYPAAEIIGRNCRFLQGERTATEPVRTLREGIDAGEPVTTELRNYRNDGTEFWNRVSIAPVRNDAGEITNFVGFQQDVTREKEQEHELTRQRQRFQAFFNDPNRLVALLDSSGTVIDANRTAMRYTSASVEAVNGKQLIDSPWFRHLPSLQDDMKQWIAQAASGEYLEFEADLVDGAGEQYTFSGVIRPVTTDSGAVISLLVSAGKVTARQHTPANAGDT